MRPKVALIILGKENIVVWCKSCCRETQSELCELCGKETEADIPMEVLRCDCCNVPVLKRANDINKLICPACGGRMKYMASDLRPVFPEERLLLEILLDKPLEYKNRSVWANANRYYIDDKVITITSKHYKKYSSDYLRKMLDKYATDNTYDYFNEIIKKFVKANKLRLNYIVDEAHTFIQQEARKYPRENIVLSFSGGKILLLQQI